MRDFFGVPLSIFSVIWNMINWNNMNIIFTLVISILTIIYLILKIRSKYLELKDRKYSMYIKRGPWIKFRKSKNK